MQLGQDIMFCSLLITFPESKSNKNYTSSFCHSATLTYHSNLFQSLPVVAPKTNPKKYQLTSHQTSVFFWGRGIFPKHFFGFVESNKSNIIKQLQTPLPLRRYGFFSSQEGFKPWGLRTSHIIQRSTSFMCIYRYVCV